MRMVLPSRAAKFALSVLLAALYGVVAWPALGHPRPSPRRGEPSSVAHTVWRIGRFDHSSNEFGSTGIDYADPKKNPVFEVGTSRDANWPRFQPGPANGMAGGREHPFTIEFTLSEPPSGEYSLKIAVLYETPQLSFLRVNINGRSGLFYFHPKLIYDSGDWEETFVPQTSFAEKTIEIPSNWLRQGQNRLVLTALDDPATPAQSLGAIAPGQSGIVYDAIELDAAPQNISNTRRAAAPKLDVEPTIFYRDVSGVPVEVVNVFADFIDSRPQGAISLEVAGQTVRHAVPPGSDFGEERIAFDIPAWSGNAASTATLETPAGKLAFSYRLEAAKKWTLFIIPHEHLDIGFTDYPAVVAELHSRSIDDAMGLQKRIPDFRWTLDGFWPVEQYMAGRSPQKQEELTSALAAGRILLPLEYSNQHTGTASLEGLARSLYPAHFFAKRNNVSIGWAQDVDVPSYSWSYASLLHDAGIKYFLGASNNWRAPILLHGRLNEHSPFYWEGPDGGRVLMWYSRAYLQMQTLFGAPAQIPAAVDSLPVFLQAYSRPDYGASAAIIFGSQLENTTLSKEQAEFPAKWNQAYAWPKLQFASVPQAMATIEQQGGGRFEVYRGDLGSFWEDGFASDAAFTALHRANQQRINSAEVFGVLPSLLGTGLRPDEGLLHAAWHNIVLFDEHTWTYASSTTQPESEETETQTWLRESRAREARREIAESVERSWAQITPLIARRAASVAVFNSLSWPRTGEVTMDLPDDMELADPASGKTVPVDVESIGRGTAVPGFGGGYRKVRFVASNVPAIGFKVYDLRGGKTAEPPPDVAAAPAEMENAFYRITLDPRSGAIRSIYDKDLKREIADESSPYSFGQYLYVTGGDDMPHNSLYRYKAGPEPRLMVHGATGGRIEWIRKYASGIDAVMQSSAVNTPEIRTDIFLPNGKKEIRISYTLTKTKVLSKEAAYFAFPFRAARPQFNYSLQTTWVDPAHDLLPGANREWFTVTDGAAIHDGDFSATVVPLDAPLVTFGDIVRGKWPEQFHPASSAIFSWVMSNYWETNFMPWQGGDFTFRYVITSGRAFDAVAATRQAREAITPLEARPIAGTLSMAPDPGAELSFLSVENPSLAVVTWKIAEDGDGTILRLRNLSNRSGDSTIRSDLFAIRNAWLCSLLEENETPLKPTADGAITVSFAPHQALTLRLRTDWKYAQGNANGSGR